MISSLILPYRVLIQFFLSSICLCLLTFSSTSSLVCSQPLLLPPYLVLSSLYLVMNPQIERNSKDVITPQSARPRENQREIQRVGEFIFREDYLVSLSHPQQQIVQHRSKPDSYEEGNIAFAVIIPL